MRRTLAFLALAICSSCSSTRPQTGPDIRYAFVTQTGIFSQAANFDDATLMSMRHDLGSDLVFFEQDGKRYVTSDRPTVLYVQQRVSRIEDSSRMMGKQPWAWERHPELFVPSVSADNGQNNNRTTSAGALDRNLSPNQSGSSVAFLERDIQDTDLEIRQRLAQAIGDGLAQPVR